MFYNPFIKFWAQAFLEVFHTIIRNPDLLTRKNCTNVDGNPSKRTRKAANALLTERIVSHF